MNNRFLLFRLPQVAVREVLSILNPFELINLSKVSSKMKQTVTFYASVWSFELRLSICSHPLIFLCGVPKFYYCYKFTTQREQDGNRRVYTQNEKDADEISIFAEDVLTKHRDYSNYLNSVLSLKIERIRFDMQHFANRNKECTDWMVSTFSSVPTVVLQGRNYVSPVDVQYLLDRLTVSQSLGLLSETGSERAIRIPKIPVYLEIMSMSWIKLEHLLELDSQSIRIVNRVFSNQELNYFLKKWMSMEFHQNLKTFATKIWWPEDLDAVLNGIENKQDDSSRPYSLDLAKDHELVAIGSGVRITRRDGVVARVGAFRYDSDVIMLMNVLPSNSVN